MDINKKLHILVVDEDLSNREHVSKILDDLGVDCTTCGTNAESVANFRRSDFDGVILETEPNVCSSFVTASRATNKRNIPIIFYSGNRVQEQYKPLVDNGYYVIQPHKLQNTIQAFIELIHEKQGTQSHGIRTSRTTNVI